MIMLINLVRHFFLAIRHVKAVILMLVALMVAVLVYAVRERIEESQAQG
jgi:hypothetical protein